MKNLCFLGNICMPLIQSPLLSKLNTLNQNMVGSIPKKRKGSTFIPSPWHNLFLKGSELCHDVSSSEQEWAFVTNTLCEKVHPNEAISPSKRRLVLSTHLMQQLLQPAPPFVFSENTAFNYETVLYFVSRITLADAFSLKCQTDLDKSRNCQTLKTANDGDQKYSALVKAFMEKMQKFERRFESLESTTSTVDIILEIKELERYSVINHLAKFHTHAMAIPRTVPQRFDVEIQMPRNLPEQPLHCLPL